jgi:uncharacterized membrane protein
VYRTTSFTNIAKNEEYRNPTTKLLLCMFVPFYSIYWYYKTAQRIDKIAKDKGVASDLATICLILAIFVPIVPPILMQAKINDIFEGKVAATAPKETDKNISDAQALEKYKELLDKGIITQEEFDIKKKEILGL